MDLTELKPYTLPVGLIPAGWLETEGRACARPSQKGHQGVCKKLQITRVSQLIWIGTIHAVQARS